MESSPSPRPSPRLLAVRVLAVAFAVSAGGFLILREQRRARPKSPPVVREAPETANTAEDDVLGSVEPSLEEPGEEPAHPAYLFSSKSAVISPVEDAPEDAVPVFLGSSKSLAPMEVAPSPYLSTSKSVAIELVQPQIENAAEEQAAADDGPPSKP